MLEVSKKKRREFLGEDFVGFKLVDVVVVFGDAGVLFFLILVYFVC